LFSCLFTTFCFKAVAQEIPHFIEKLTTDNGLSSNKINDIAQDDNGFLWIATTDGLNRFDGTEVVQYFHRDHVNSISHDYVYCLEKLPSNYIAIATQAGLDFYNSSTGIFTNFYYKQNNPIDEYNNIITKLELDSQGNLWAASGGCIYIFDSSRNLKKIIPSSFTEADISRNRMRFVEKMLPLSNGIRVFSLKDDQPIDLRNSSLYNDLRYLDDLFNLSAVQKEYSPYANVFKIFNRYILCVKPSIDSLFVFDEKGNLSSCCYFPYNKYPYILWSQKISVMDSSRLLFLFHNYGFANLTFTWTNGQPVIHPPGSLLLEDYEYDGALRDRQSNWWLATTETGLQKISPGKQYFKNFSLTDNTTGKQGKYDVLSVSAYKQTIWASTYGNGFFALDFSSGKQKQYFVNSRPPNQWANFIWNVRQLNEDTVWVGTQAGLFWYCLSNNKNGRITGYPGKPSILDSVAITTQFIDSYGRVWMGLGRGNGVCFFDTKTNRFFYYPGNSAKDYPLRYPTRIAEDKKGNLWFVNDASGSLVYLEKNTRHFQKIILENASHKGLGNLSAIWCGNDNNIWLGTATDGLVKFNPVSRQVTVYGHDKGLNNNHISSIYEDEGKRLWLVTEGDLSFFDQRSETFTGYTEKKAYPSPILPPVFILMK
jgi:ligand-binding sensor domain-containing protein